MKKLTDKDFYSLWGEALASSDREMYVAEHCTSIIFGAPEDIADEDMVGQAAYLGRIWDVAHMTIQDIRTAAELTQSAMATRFCIPKRTIENWCAGDRSAPDYIRLMMAQLLGLLVR